MVDVVTGVGIFDSSQKIDQDDFERQLDAAKSVSVTEELREITTGDEVAAKMREAKVNALLRARKKLAQSIDAEYQKRVSSHSPFIFAGVSRDLNSYLDEGTIKVQA